MKPIEFEEQNVVFAKDQPAYQPLPAYRAPDGQVVSCWELTPEELKHIQETGKIYLSVLTFNRPLQPCSVYVFKNELFFDKNEEPTIGTL